MGRSTLRELESDRNPRPLYSYFILKIEEQCAVDRFVGMRDHDAANRRIAEYRYQMFFDPLLALTQLDMEENFRLSRAIKDVLIAFWADAD